MVSAAAETPSPSITERSPPPSNQARFERLRSGARLTSEMIERECQDIAREALRFRKAERPSGGEGVDPRDDYLTDRMGFGDALAQGDFSPVRGEAEEIISRLGVVAPAGSAEWQELCRALLHTHAEVYRIDAAPFRGGLLATLLNPMLAGVFQTGGSTTRLLSRRSMEDCRAARGRMVP
jgi:hypothetical protein